MRSFWMILNVVIGLTLSFEAAALNSTTDTSPREPSATATCRYISGDVGTIIGRGSSKSAAFSDAAEQCFDRRVKMYEQIRRATVDMDRGQDFIDSCANLTCS